MNAPSQPMPNRLAVYRALCQLSPEAYPPLARLILEAAHADTDAQRWEQQRRRNGRHVAQAGNIGKPVITISGDGGEGA